MTGAAHDVSNVPKWSPNTIEQRMRRRNPVGIGSRRLAVSGFGKKAIQNEAEMVGFQRTGE